jgi:hypothetical protein
LGDVVSQLFFGILVFNAAPTLVDFVGPKGLSNLGSMFQIFLPFNMWRKETELIALVLGEFSAHLARIVVAIDVNFPNLFTAKLANAVIAPFVIGTSAVSAPAGMADIGAVERIDDDRDVA